ncbi:unnamed protein product [Acanthoscelides obtectus]|uniref:Corticotropin-releasing factor-binding protein n=3 Tax=Acanthoscelides obtectus TaxID=200917 RepID=A0A9P0PP95_ACAOB|nr:unnamed protein product [Acanthoscelides obtectus]CAK1666286.1 Corticotropin-releasing factor-binding protein [Acanthoscelides obtectus]
MSSGIQEVLLLLLGITGFAMTAPSTGGKIEQAQNSHHLVALEKPSKLLTDLPSFSTGTAGELMSKRPKRSSEHHITDCIYMSSEEGEYFHKATAADGSVCGAYIFTEPDQNVEIYINYLNVPCENGGLVVVVDGWELNGEFFPSREDHPRPMRTRLTELCGQKKIKKVFVSSQNVALIQYRMPARGSSFSFYVRFIKNPNPCNILFQTDDVYTLRNYGRKSNCSLSTLFPATVTVAALDVGLVPVAGPNSGSRRASTIELETGIVHKCQTRGLEDYVQIGGSPGLDNNNLMVADTVCGLASKPGKHPNVIACDTTTVRLVSSGEYDNSITVYLRQLDEQDINGFMDVVCLPDEVQK